MRLITEWWGVKLFAENAAEKAQLEALASVLPEEAEAFYETGTVYEAKELPEGCIYGLVIER